MEKINIAELLKDCPQGMELDCTMFEDIEFDSIVDNKYTPIRCRIKNPDGGYNVYFFTKYGYWNDDCKAKCVIFPKGKTTWEGFQRPFTDGDILATNDGKFIAIIKKNGGKYHCCCHINGNYFVTDYSGWFDRLATEKEKQILFDAIRNNGYCWNAETKTLQHLFPYGIGTKVWVKSDKERKYIHTIVGISRNSFGNLEYEVKEDKTGTVVHYPKDLLIPITTKFKVGDKIRLKSKPNYVYTIHSLTWDDNNKLAYRLLPDNDKHLRVISLIAQDEYELALDKFDFNTLKPFAQVLVRCSNNGIWNPQFFSRFRPKSKFPFECTYNSWIQCVPYEGNEYLWNTTNKCDEFYKIWEDE